MVRNSTTSWGWISIVFHWIGAAAILTLLIHGWWMTHMVTGSRASHYEWHAALGYDLLALLIIRLLWRWMNPVPQYPSDFKPWERWSARLGHLGLYVLMFGSTVAGWALVGTGRRIFDHDLLGLKVPLIYTSQDRAMHGLLEETHEILSYLLLALILIHLVGALRHHLVKRNDVMRRMLWSTGRSAEPVAGRQAAE
jgi:cytochrome b561